MEAMPKTRAIARAREYVTVRQHTDPVTGTTLYWWVSDYPETRGAQVGPPHTSKRVVQEECACIRIAKATRECAPELADDASAIAGQFRRDKRAGVALRWETYVGGANGYYMPDPE